MQPAAVFPLHDPDGLLLPQLAALTPDLKQVFCCAFVLPSVETRARPSAPLRSLEADPFFRLFYLDGDPPVGDEFAFLYHQAALASLPDQILHLCFLDRLAFALRTKHRNQFLADVASLSVEDLPLIFQRSAKAWRSHPRNYYEIESFVTTVGRLLFGRELDYAWCHLALNAAQLRSILPRVHNHDLSLVAEMILQIQNVVKTREVDWLAWEDPFVLSRPSADLKREREGSLVETCKRLTYALPMVEAMQKFAVEQEKQ